MFKGQGKNQARPSTQKMEPLNNVNIIRKNLLVMYTKGEMETYSGSESTQAA